MKSKPLSEILTEDQINEVVRIISEEPDLRERVNKLKCYLKKFKRQLRAGGLIPEYLAYVIAYQASTKISLE